MLYEFTKLHLDKEEFDNLVFMNPPYWWEEDYLSDDFLENERKFLRSLCCQPLKEVVEKVRERAGYEEQEQNSTEIFEKLLDITARDKTGSSEREPWFSSHKSINRCFSIDRMPPIWIRNLSSKERKECPKGSYYIEDGNTRSLVYALRVFLGEADQTPFPAIHATSWGVAAEILEHLPEKASELENRGVLQYKKHFKEGVRLPIGIRIDTYERR